jgi:hypothetical protein
MKYFRQEEDPKARFPKSFISGFLEVSHPVEILLSSSADYVKGRN